MPLFDLIGRFSAYVSYRLPEAKEIKIDEFERIHGGASRETYRLKIRYLLNGEATDSRLILRVDPEHGLIDTELDREFDIYCAFHGTDIPVPKPIWLEQDPKWFGRTFFVMEEIQGCETDRFKIFEPPYDAVTEKIAEEYTRILGLISKTDPEKVGLLDEMAAPSPDECWSRELDYWEEKIIEDELEPQPIVRAAIRWLRRNPPPPAQKVGVVHGDYRVGNFLYNEAGEIRGILDWETCHLGDPIEDITWGANPLWIFSRPDKVGGMIEQDKYISIWEDVSGLEVNPGAFHWWVIFSSVKALSIWMSAGRKYADGINRKVFLGRIGWMTTDLQNFILLNQLGH